ncbi:MAG: HAD hydrolase-like protein [Pseudonocardiaceae bacterium]|nr:HAD hydrolase-like protein [Pseudonocardiaceae bacterium]
MAAEGPKRLVLWDIDHTLIDSRGVGRSIYERIFPEVTGQPLGELAMFHGRTELDIMHDTLRLHGIEPSEPTVNRLAAALGRGFGAAIAELTARGRVLPGVWQALESLAAEPDTLQSVLTGNTAVVARVKLEAFGLDRYLDLPVGAYGDDHRDRAELVAISRGRVAHRTGVTIPAEHVVLVGDTPNDVHAALTAGAQVIAVATGSYSVAELRAAGAMSILDSLADLPLLRQALATR